MPCSQAALGWSSPPSPTPSLMDASISSVAPSAAIPSVCHPPLLAAPSSPLNGSACCGECFGGGGRFPAALAPPGLSSGIAPALSAQPVPTPIPRPQAGVISVGTSSTSHQTFGSGLSIWVGGQPAESSCTPAGSLSDQRAERIGVGLRLDAATLHVLFQQATANPCPNGCEAPGRLVVHRPYRHVCALEGGPKNQKGQQPTRNLPSV